MGMMTDAIMEFRFKTLNSLLPSSGCLLYVDSIIPCGSPLNGEASFRRTGAAQWLRSQPCFTEPAKSCLQIAMKPREKPPQERGQKYPRPSRRKSFQEMTACVPPTFFNERHPAGCKLEGIGDQLPGFLDLGYLRINQVLWELSMELECIFLHT